MIKDFDTYIKESRLGRNLRTSFSDNVRKEDDFSAISNIKEIQPVDVGCKNIVWSDKNLIVNGEVYFDWEKWHDFEYDGWRLPTFEEVEELRELSDTIPDDQIMANYDVRMLSRKSGKILQLRTRTGEKLEFPDIVFGYLNTKHGTIWGEKFAVIMTAKETEVKYHGNTDGYFVSQISTTSINNCVYDKYNHTSIRLVKDK